VHVRGGLLTYTLPIMLEESAQLAQVVKSLVTGDGFD
jgi:hypothetical protein